MSIRDIVLNITHCSIAILGCIFKSLVAINKAHTFCVVDELNISV